MSVGAIIQARMSSSRLPGKTLLPIPLQSGKPLLQWVVDELKLSKKIGKIVLATSTNEANNVLISFAEKIGIENFRGSEDDVLSRFVAIIKKKEFDHVVRITGDNPILDVSLLDALIEEHIKQGVDYTISEGLPIGMNMEVVRASSLIKIFERSSLSEADREHVTFFFRRNSEFRTLLYPFNFNLKNARLTIDYPADFAALSLILDVSMSSKKKGIELINYIDANMPWIWNVNNFQVQKQTYQTTDDELIEAHKLLENLDMKFAAKLIKEYRDKLKQ